MKVGKIIKTSINDILKLLDVPVVFMVIAISAVVSASSFGASEESQILSFFSWMITLGLGFLMTILRIDCFYLFKKGKLQELKFSNSLKKFQVYFMTSMSYFILNAFIIFIIMILIQGIRYVIEHIFVLKINEMGYSYIMISILVVVAIYLYIRLSYYSYAVIIDGNKKALENSLKITKGYFFKLFTLFLVSVVFAMPYVLVLNLANKIKMNSLMSFIISLPFLIIFLSVHLAVQTNVFLELKKLWEEKNMEKAENSFDERAKTWEEPIKIKRAEDFFEKIKKELDMTQIKTMLDFGAGTGLLTLKFKDYINKIDALDSSNGMLNILKEKLYHYKINNIHPINTKISELDENYDLIFSSMVFHHIEDIDDLVKNIKEKLNKNGIVMIVDLIREDGSFHQNMDGIFYHGFAKEEICEHFEKNGFTNIEFKDELRIKKTIKNGEIKEFKVFTLKAYKGE